MSILLAQARPGQWSPSAAHQPVALLDDMVRRRPILGASFRAAIARHEHADAADLDAWAAAVLRLAYANAGTSALMVLLRMSAVAAGPEALAGMARAADAAAEICRRAGSGAARAVVEARADLSPRFATAVVGDEEAWWRGFVRLATEAQDCVQDFARAIGAFLARCGPAEVEPFVTAGLRAGADRDKRRSYFSLQSPDARRILDRLSGQATFQTLEPVLRVYVTALWGQAYPIRELPPVEHRDNSPSRRTAVSSGIILLPDVFDAEHRASTPALYRASVAHASAHLRFGAAPFDPGRLKPIQIVLVGLIEDARVETLALRCLPGLRGLWAPFHTAEPSHLKTATSILARLARGLFDSDHQDPDGIVLKGRTLFGAEPDLEDPTLSRRIGTLLGNDIGQMRIQFDARQHVVDPAYRDDNLGLWILPPPPPDALLHDVDVAVQSARMERREGEGNRRSDQHEGQDGAGCARLVAPDQRGIAVARYPEWDQAAGLERPDWVTVREVEPPHGNVDAIADAVAQNPGLKRRIERLVRHARVGRPTRLRRQPDGIDLDVDAAIDAVTAMRSGELPEDRIHSRKVLRSRDLAVLVLIDISESTRDRVPATGTSVLAVETLAVALLAEALAALGDRFALRAFSSNGRDEVRILRIKDLSDPFDVGARARLAGLEPGYSTRLGAALRHAGAELDAVAATRRIVIALTDGVPSDIDVDDPAELIEDARRAVLGLYGRGIDVFGITLDPTGQGAGTAVFGRANHRPVRNIEELPSRLSELYFRIARR